MSIVLCLPTARRRYGLGIADWDGLGDSHSNQGRCEEQRLGGFNNMSVLDIRKSFRSAFALCSALFVGSVLCVGSLQAQTPLDEFKAFLTNPPPIEEIVFERKLMIALPTPPGVTNMLLTGPFFQLRLQTNAYFVRQMQVMGEAPGNHRAGNLLEGAWDDTYWAFSNNQMNLWTNRKQAELKGEIGRSKIFDPIFSLGLDERINPSTIVWNGDTFTAQGTNSLRFEGRIESKTTNGLPTRIVTWAVHTTEFHRCIDYEYRGSFHPWFPVAIKPFLEKRAGGMPFLGKGTGKVQEFYVSSLKMGGSPLSQENFLPTQFTNANTLTILHTKGGMEFFDRNGKLTLVPTSPPPPSNKTLPSSSASPANAPPSSPPSANRAPPPPPSPPPSSILLIVALVCLSIPPLLFIFFKTRANRPDAR